MAFTDTVLSANIVSHIIVIENRIVDAKYSMMYNIKVWDVAFLQRKVLQYIWVKTMGLPFTVRLRRQWLSSYGFTST